MKLKAGDIVIYDPNYEVDSRSEWANRRGARFEVVRRRDNVIIIVKWIETDSKYPPPRGIATNVNPHEFSFPDYAFKIDTTTLRPDWEV